MAKEKEDEEKEKRKEYTIKIGPLLKNILENQKENIKKASYGCLKPSDYDVGEIIAKKIIERFGGIKECGKDII